MADIAYLSSDDAVALHADFLERMGGEPSPLLYPDRLDAALTRPRNAAYYEGADLVRQGVILAVGLSQAQAFQDGNKRVAFQATVVFLELNGLAFQGDPMALARWLIVVAETSRIDRDAEIDQFEAWLRDHLIPVDRAGDSA